MVLIGAWFPFSHFIVSPSLSFRVFSKVSPISVCLGLLVLVYSLSTFFHDSAGLGGREGVVCLTLFFMGSGATHWGGIL